MEVGGGVGRNALAILDWFEATQPVVYDSMRYTLLDVSPEQSAFQAEAVGGRHGSRCRVLVCPEARWATAIAALPGAQTEDQQGQVDQERGVVGPGEGL